MPTPGPSSCPVPKRSPSSSALRQRISQPSMPTLLGELVEQALERERDLRHAEAAHGAARRVVGVDGQRFDVDVGHAIRAARVAGGALEHLGADTGVGAGVADDPRAHGDEAAVGVAAGRVVERHGVALGMEAERLGAAEADQHRAAGQVREQRRRALGAQVFLAAEGAAGGTCVTRTLVFGQGQDRGQLAAVLPRALALGIDAQRRRRPARRAPPRARGRRARCAAW